MVFTYANISIRHGGWQNRMLDVTPRDRERFKRWAELGILQAVPRGADDDW
jgi:hypothetical protein